MHVCKRCKHINEIEPLMSYDGDTSCLVELGVIGKFRVMVTPEANFVEKMYHEEFERLTNKFRKLTTEQAMHDSEYLKYSQMYCSHSL